MTPRLFRTLMDQHDLLLKRRDSMGELMIAQLIAMVANTGFRSFKSPRQAKEFMPSAWDQDGSKPAQKRKMTYRQRSKGFEVRMNLLVARQKASG